jgi:hypothetical protein
MLVADEEIDAGITGGNRVTLGLELRAVGAHARGTHK